ncbi:MAG: hypothetical protein LUO93_11090 [Methanomicrobiales archaeon]|nr:hypothetical protein [Methanomicrobiales archaeon]
MTRRELDRNMERITGSMSRFSREWGNQNPPVRFVPGGIYQGEGRSRGLSRGLLVLDKGENLTREGLGIGCPVALDYGETVFSRTHYEWKEQEGCYECTFSLDTGLGWGITGQRSRVLSQLVNGAVDLYMKHPALQPLLLIGNIFRSFFLIRPVWYEIPAKTEVEFRYQIKGDSVEITCRIHGHGWDLPTICLLNELGGEAFCTSWSEGEEVAPPRGWECYPHPLEQWLFDPSRGLHFRIALGRVSEGIATHLFWGRERTRDLCWAGYGIELVPERLITTATCRYTVTVSRGGME